MTRPKKGRGIVELKDARCTVSAVDLEPNK